MKILHPICLKFAVIFLLFYTAAWSRQRPLSCWSWHRRNDFQLLINRTWKLLTKVFKWSPIVCLLLLTVMKNSEKYECRSLWVKISESGRFYTSARKRTGKREISGISSFVQDILPHKTGGLAGMSVTRCQCHQRSLETKSPGDENSQPWITTTTNYQLTHTATSTLYL